MTELSTILAIPLGQAPVYNSQCRGVFHGRNRNPQIRAPPTEMYLFLGFFARNSLARTRWCENVDSRLRNIVAAAASQNQVNSTAGITAVKLRRTAKYTANKSDFSPLQAGGPHHPNRTAELYSLWSGSLDPEPLLFQCWLTVFDGEPALKQHWLSISRCLYRDLRGIPL